jgi:hypothetical protein
MNKIDQRRLENFPRTLWAAFLRKGQSAYPQTTVYVSEYGPKHLADIIDKGGNKGYAKQCFVCKKVEVQAISISNVRW